jgi:hypothetical protein
MKLRQGPGVRSLTGSAKGRFLTEQWSTEHGSATLVGHLNLVCSLLMAISLPGTGLLGSVVQGDRTWEYEDMQGCSVSYGCRKAIELLSLFHSNNGQLA